MPSLLGHRLSLWITQKENGPEPTTRAQCEFVGAVGLRVGAMHLDIVPILGIIETK
jgi:hypothetical protein